MRQGENKRLAFKRLGTNRANRIIKDISLLGNLSNRHNYSYTEDDVKSMFGAIEEEIHLAKSRYLVSLKRGRKIKL